MKNKTAKTVKTAPQRRQAAEPRNALRNFLEIRNFLDDQLADRTPAGRAFSSNQRKGFA
jgi:hypothetical protein